MNIFAMLLILLIAPRSAFACQNYNLFSGNSSTATALAVNPTDCSAGNFATTIDARGNLTCSTAVTSVNATAPQDMSVGSAVTGSGSIALSRRAMYDAGNSGSSITIDWNNGAYQRVTLTAATPALTFSNPVNGEMYILEMVQDNTGSRLPTLPNAVSLPLWGQVGVSTGPNQISTLVLKYNGTGYNGNLLKNQTEASVYASFQSVTGRTWWLDANDYSRITLTNNASTVSALNDKSGNGYNGTQTTASRRPTLVASSLNGLAGLLFPTGTVLDFGTTQFINTGSAFTLFVVVRWDTAGTNSNVLCLKNDNAQDVRLGLSNSAGFTDVFWGANAAWTPIRWPLPGSTTGTAYRITLSYNGSGAGTSGNFAAYVNSSSAAISSASAFAANTQNNLVGANDSTGSNYLNGTVHEVLIYNSLLSSGDRGYVDTYLSTKWGI